MEGEVTVLPSALPRLRYARIRSVRIPAGFTNIYSLRPSYNRLPYEGTANSLEGQEAISSVIGPMASHISALKTFTKAVLGAKPWNRDPLVMKKPWSDAEYRLEDHGGPGAKLCFAIMVDNGVVRPHPPVKRAIQMVAEALREAGHTGEPAFLCRTLDLTGCLVIDWENCLHMDIFTISVCTLQRSVRYGAQFGYSLGTYLRSRRWSRF